MKDESPCQLSADLLNTWAVLVLLVDLVKFIFQQHYGHLEIYKHALELL